MTNLQTSSNDIKKQINYALSSTGNFTAVSTNGYIVDPNAYTSLTISAAQKDAYNAALSTFQTTSFYNAQQFLTDRANEQIVNLQGSIHDLAVAAVDLQSAATVNQIIAGVSDSPTAQAAQTAIANSGLNTEITATQVASFNNSLQMVNTYATQAGAFFASAKNNTITSNIDLSAANYNKTLYTASAAYAYAGDQLTINFDGTYAIGFAGFTSDKQISAANFFMQPQIYGGQ